MSEATGLPLQKALVEIIDERKNKRLAAVLTDRRGMFDFGDNYGDGSHRLLRISMPEFGYMVVEERVAVNSREGVPLVIRLPLGI